MRKEIFLECCKEIFIDGHGIYVKVEIPGNIHPEKISNDYEDLGNKIEYYDKTYDENMEHKFAKGVKIISVGAVE